MKNKSREEKELYVINKMNDRDKNVIRRLSDEGLDGVIRLLNRDKVTK